VAAPVNIVCMKWGTRYPSHYVNILFRSIGRNLSRPFRFLCITDDPAELLPEIETCGFPDNPGITQSAWPNVFMKLVITRDGFADLAGPTLFLDLDLVVLGELDPLFDYHPGDYCIIHNWIELRKQLLRPRPAIGNSSVFRFDAGSSNELYETFIREIEDADDRSKFRTEQAFLTHAMKSPRWWPESWIRSFKYHCRPPFPLNLALAPSKPRNARLLVFHGTPDPDDAINGHRSDKVHHSVRPAPWLADYWKL
jgi:hypothetical protein